MSIKVSLTLNIYDRKFLQLTVFVKNPNRRWDVRVFKPVCSTRLNGNYA